MRHERIACKTLYTRCPKKGGMELYYYFMSYITIFFGHPVCSPVSSSLFPDHAIVCLHICVIELIISLKAMQTCPECLNF